MTHTPNSLGSLRRGARHCQNQPMADGRRYYGGNDQFVRNNERTFCKKDRRSRLIYQPLSGLIVSRNFAFRVALSWPPLWSQKVLCFMAALSETSLALGWLGNFEPKDRATASLLLNKLMLISASEFASGITKQLDQISREREVGLPCVALYAEREVNKRDHIVLPFFPGTDKRRAVGDGIQPVQVDPKKQNVGSEGIIAALVSKYSKDPVHRSLSHPGPDALRENRIRSIAVVTDFVGSGRRVSEMLDAFALVASIRSWVSYGLLKFHVVCYSGTEWGLNCVRHHPLRPQVLSYIACPIIDEAFTGSELGAIKLLCKTYPGSKSRIPFGFNRTGSLIAFSHGIPNNAPALLHSSAGGWKPLFPGRSTLAADLDKIADNSQMLAQYSERVLGIREARRVLSGYEGELWVHSMLVLNAVNRGARTATKLSALTQIPIARVEEILELAKTAGWLTPKQTLSRLGRREIGRMSFAGLTEEEFAFPESSIYFPTQLRAP